MKRSLSLLTAISLSFLVLAGCSDDATEATNDPMATAVESEAASETSVDTEPTEGTASANETANDAEFPNVESAYLIWTGRGNFKVKVTMSSRYDTPDRYADGWRVLTPEGEVLAEHELHHDHQHEQPFTRVRGPFFIGPDVAEVIVEGRDSENGYGGETVTIEVPHGPGDGAGDGRGSGQGNGQGNRNR